MYDRPEVSAKYEEREIKGGIYVALWQHWWSFAKIFRLAEITGFARIPRLKTVATQLQAWIVFPFTFSL